MGRGRDSLAVELWWGFWKKRVWWGKDFGRRGIDCSGRICDEEEIGFWDYIGDGVLEWMCG